MNSKISSPYRDDIVISWPELHRDTRILCHALMEKGPFKGIIAIARGGMIPAALVARELEIRLLDTIWYHECFSRLRCTQQNSRCIIIQCKAAKTACFPQHWPIKIVIKIMAIINAHTFLFQRRNKIRFLDLLRLLK